MSARFLLIGLFSLFWGMSCSLESSVSEACFIGDSIVKLWDLDYFFSGYYIHKHAVGGAVLQNVDDWDVSDCRGMPIVVLMGTNNIGNNSVLDNDAKKKREKFNEMFVQRMVSLDANPLWVISILPRKYGNSKQEDVNQNIKLQNELLKKSLDSLGNAYGFIDVFDFFLKDDYQIDSTLFNDGLHPNERGYEILTSKVMERL